MEAAFSDALDFCSLSDATTKGQKFTLSNNKRGMAFTKEMLDIAVAISEWDQPFVNTTCLVMPTQKYDHFPLYISSSCRNRSNRRRSKVFRYEAAWALREDYEKTIEEAWGKQYSISRGWDFSQ